MKPDEDPEVVADLQLRARTERERGDRRDAPAPTWEAPEIVGRWRCRGCQSHWLVDVPYIAMERFIAFNSVLKARAEATLDDSRIVFCDACRAEGKRQAPIARRNHVERLRGVIQKLKRSHNPEEERELILQCEALSHPDTAGLVQSIRERLNARGSKKGGAV